MGGTERRKKKKPGFLEVLKANLLKIYPPVKVGCFVQDGPLALLREHDPQIPVGPGHKPKGLHFPMLFFFRVRDRQAVPLEPQFEHPQAFLQS